MTMPHLNSQSNMLLKQTQIDVLLKDDKYRTVIVPEKSDTQHIDLNMGRTSDIQNEIDMRCIDPLPKMP